ncbi:hypothetical protein [Streptomyces sp. NPDC057460]|uniref:hypothetical protein n=1 Tax=Streptomyces sp. NPDC057460 TaxID=3346141 RepID=UPI0036883E2C
MTGPQRPAHRAGGAHRDELRRRRILPVISRKGAPNIKAVVLGFDQTLHRT